MDPNHDNPTFDSGFDAAVVELYRDHLSRQSTNYIRDLISGIKMTLF
jgi:hypothetical protein